MSGYTDGAFKNKLVLIFYHNLKSSHANYYVQIPKTYNYQSLGHDPPGMITSPSRRVFIINIVNIAVIKFYFHKE